MGEDAPVLTISQAAGLARMHPQTLRQYDRLGLVSPQRTAGRGRRYSLRDVMTLREIQRLSQDDGVNLAGIKRILALQEQVRLLQRQVAALDPDTVFTAGTSGDVVAVARARHSHRWHRDVASARAEERGLVLWSPSQTVEIVDAMVTSLVEDDDEGEADSGEKGREDAV